MLQGVEIFIIVLFSFAMGYLAKAQHSKLDREIAFKAGIVEGLKNTNEVLDKIKAEIDGIK